MTDILITLLVFGSLPFILKRPHVGVLVWSWLSYMNPHRLAWGFAYSMSFAQVVAITLFISLFFTKEKLNIPKNFTFIIWLIFVVWMVITTIFSIDSERATDYLIRVLKIQLITFVTLMVMTSFERINQLIWVIVGSIGFFSVKGGFFTLITGGTYRVWGPRASFIEENNALALATLMILPLMIYLLKAHKRQKWVVTALVVSMMLSIVSVVGSQSRGALVAIIAVAVFFWMKSKAKIASSIAIISLGFAIFSFMPPTWHDRMESILDYQEDLSAMGRINAWHYSVNVANDRFLGAGFESWSGQTFAVWAPDPTDVHVAHSIYFNVLADHGWLGLVLFLLILLLTWLSLSKTIRTTKKSEDYESHNFLAKMLKVSLVAYLSGGAFLSLSYWDLPWHIIAIALLLAQKIVPVISDSTDSVFPTPSDRSLLEPSRIQRTEYLP